MEERRRLGRAPGIAVLLLGAIACSAGGSMDAASDHSPGGGSAGAGGSNGGYDAGAGGAGGSTPPPEKQLEGSYQSPVATARFVWSANPTSGRVAYIDASTLEVRTVEAGDGPTFLAPVPTASDDVAVVLNVLSDDATLLSNVGGQLTSETIPVAHGANRWAVSQDGLWAIAWTDAKQVETPDPTQGFQDVTVLGIDAASHTAVPTILSVGYRPVKLSFAASGASAFAVTEDGVSVIDLTGVSPAVTRNVALSTDLGEDPLARDVWITPKGDFAIVRREGSPELRIVDLDVGALTTLTLSGPVTDLDLSDTGDRAVAVVRDTSEVAVVPIPDAATKPNVTRTIPITGETVGSSVLAPGGKTALLFTNATANDHLTVLDLDAAQPTFRVIQLHAPVLAVFPTADAAHAIVVHDKAAIGGTMPGAISVVPVAAELPAKIVGTDAPPQFVALAPSSDRAFVTVRDDASKTYGVYLARMPSLAVDRYDLASPPDAVGVVSGSGLGFVAQNHPEGRITFIDMTSGQARTLTGFELGAHVVDGSQP